MRSLRNIGPNQHLGFAATREEWFWNGVAALPRCLAADSGASINLTIYRPRAHGNPDCFGGWQFAPVLDLRLPGEQVNAQ